MIIWTYTMGTTTVYGWQASHDALGRPVSTADSESAARTWTYNARSEMTGCVSNDGQYSYAYDCENRLVSVTPVSPSSGDLAIVNEYDHMNRRVRKTVRRYDGMGWSDQERHSFVWDGWNIVLERIDAGGSVTRMIEYYWGEDFSGTEQGAGNAPVAKRSGRLSEANPKGRKGPCFGGLLWLTVDGVIYIPCYDNNSNVTRYLNVDIGLNFSYNATVVGKGTLKLSHDSCK